MKEKCTLITKGKKKKCFLKITKKGNIKLILKNKIKKIGEESILQSNIDSKCIHDYIKCKCGKDNAFLITDNHEKQKYYYCLTCNRIYKIKKEK